jgi:hypothetical protein
MRGAIWSVRMYVRGEAFSEILQNEAKVSVTIRFECKAACQENRGFGGGRR